MIVPVVLAALSFVMLVVTVVYPAVQRHFEQGKQVKPEMKPWE